MTQDQRHALTTRIEFRALGLDWEASSRTYHQRATRRDDRDLGVGLAIILAVAVLAAVFLAL